MLRRPVWILVLLSLCAAFACGPASVDPRTAGAIASCTDKTLDVCEDAIHKALAAGDDVSGLVRAYVAARQSVDGDDTAAAWLEALTEAGKKSRAAMVVSPGQKAPETDVPAVAAPAPFSTKKADREHGVHAALAATAGLDYLAIVRPDGLVARYFPKDPLAPFGLGTVPYAIDRGPMMATDRALEAALRETAAAASKSDYLAAARAVDRVDALVEARDPFDVVTVRAKTVSSVLGLSATKAPLSVSAPASPAPPEPRETDTAYYHLLRVRTDPARAKAYDKRRDRILAAMAPELHAPIDALYADRRPGCAPLELPKLATVGDLAFARLLPTLLRPAHTILPQGRLDLRAWYARYADLVALVDRTDTEWMFVHLLVLERGGTAGIVPAGSQVHRRVTKLALGHARALLAVAKAEPGRVGFGQLGFLIAPGNYIDDELREAVVEVGRVTAASTLATSEDAWAVIGAAFASVLVAFSMPPELREAHLTALQGAFTARLRGDLAKMNGWGVALAFSMDALYRVALDFAPDLPAAVHEVTRALEAEGVEQPGLAALTSALVRYGALAAQGGLGPPVLEPKDTALPGRAAARSALKKALARLGDGAAPPPQALEELTDLVDGAAATLAFAVAELARPEPQPAAKRAKAPGKADECPAGDAAPVNPKIVRALGKLGDLSKRVRKSRTIAGGTDAWAKRARLVTLLVSDAVDVGADAAKPAPKTKGQSKSRLPEFSIRFSVPTADAEKQLRDAIETFGVDATESRVAVSSYSLVRGYLGGAARYFETSGAKDASAFLTAVSELLAASRGMESTSKLFGVLARSIGKQSQMAPVFVEVARTLYKDGDRQPADMVLLAALVTASLSEEPIHPAVIELADAEESQVAWALKFVRETRNLEKGDKMAPTSFVAGLDALVSEKCAAASGAEIAAFFAAVQRYRDGDRDAARGAMDAWLDRAEKKLVVPRVSYAFRQETATRVFNLTLEVGLGGGVLGGVHSFNVGAGAKSSSDPVLSLDTTVDAPDSKRTLDDRARYYTHAAALAGVFHFASGDAKRGEAAAARALGAVTQTTWLHTPGITDDPSNFASAAVGTFAVLAQQAADAGRPFLAGSLWTVVRQNGGFYATPDDMAALLDPVPPLLAGTKDLTPTIERTKKTLRLLAAGLPCGGPRSDKAVHLKTTCATYAGSLSLRIADALAALPSLDPKQPRASCADLAALDAFLTPAATGRYEPDRLQDAAAKLLDADKALDAAFVLTRHRQPNHCAPAVTQAMRKAAAQLDRVPTTRADLLSAIVNCSAGSVTSTLVADLSALDDEVRRIGDAKRQLEVGLFAAGLGLQHGEPGPLLALAKKPDFVARHREDGPAALGVALVLDHASSALAGQPIRLQETKPDVDLLCGAVPPRDRAELCRMLEVLRTPGRTADDRKKAAESTLRKLVGG
jgi:hypothetical protein